MRLKGINDEIRTILRIANLLDLYEEAIKLDFERFESKNRTRKPHANKIKVSYE
jgi:NTP pyrophosphatase (non-canonical NTP hydrolase)